MAANIIDVTDTNFQAEVIESEHPVLVDFWAPWCGPCRVVAPVLEEIASERDDLRIVKLNVDENQVTAAQYQVLSIPTLILFKDGDEAKKVIGAYPKKRLEAELEPVLASSARPSAGPAAPRRPGSPEARRARAALAPRPARARAAPEDAPASAPVRARSAPDHPQPRAPREVARARTREEAQVRPVEEPVLGVRKAPARHRAPTRPVRDVRHAEHDLAAGHGERGQCAQR